MCVRTKITSVLSVLLLNASLAGVLSARTLDDRPASPRLAALQDRLKSGDREALDNFWKELSERGAPIVKEVPGNDRDVLVKKMPPPVPSLTGNTTFTLAGHTDAEAVAIYGSFNDWIQTKNYCLMSCFISLWDLFVPIKTSNPRSFNVAATSAASFGGFLSLGTFVYEPFPITKAIRRSLVVFGAESC